MTQWYRREEDGDPNLKSDPVLSRHSDNDPRQEINMSPSVKKDKPYPASLFREVKVPPVMRLQTHTWLKMCNTFSLPLLLLKYQPVCLCPARAQMQRGAPDPDGGPARC